MGGYFTGLLGRARHRKAAIPGTGDSTVDKRLTAINKQAKSDLRNFVTRTSEHFDIPPEVVDGLQRMLSKYTTQIKVRDRVS